MPKFARVVDNAAVDVSHNPERSFHPIIAAEFIQVPDKVKPGWVLADGEWSAPVFADPVVPATEGNLTPTPPEFLLLLTLQERVAIRAAGPTDVVIEDVLRMIDDPRVTFIDLTNPSVAEAINYLTGTEPPLLTTGRAARVLAGLSVGA